MAVAPLAAQPTQYLISTLAGRQLPGTSGPATAFDIGIPFDVAADQYGSVYFSTTISQSLYAVFKIDSAGTLTRVAGSETWAYTGDNGPAIRAGLTTAGGIAVDRFGNLYIADPGAAVVRKVAPSGIITTVAGTGVYGFSGDNGQAVSARLAAPTGVAVDRTGNLFIADTNNSRIRRVSPGGVITTVAGTGVDGYSGDNGPATGANLYHPYRVVADGNGNLFIADTYNNRVRKVSAGGTITTVAGNGSFGGPADGTLATSGSLSNPVGIAVDSSGKVYVGGFDPRLYVVDASGIIHIVAGSGVSGYSGDGGAPAAASISNIPGVAVNALGEVVFTDNRRIRKISSGTIVTIAGGATGDGGPAVFGGGLTVSAIASGSAGYLYLATADNRIRMITPAGVIWTLAGTGVTGYSGDNGLAANATLNNPSAVVADKFGTLYVADQQNHRVRKIGSNGVITTYAGTGTAGYTGDHGPAAHAQLNNPEGLAVDALGNLYVADASNSVVRKVGTDGTIVTVAGNGTSGFSGDNGPATQAQLTYPWGLAVDPSGNLYIADLDNYRVRRVAPNGTITTFAGTGTPGASGDGGPATAAQMYQPNGVATDSNGNVYILAGGRVRLVNPAGTITTIAGGGSLFYGDGTFATSAYLPGAQGISTSPDGRIYLSDWIADVGVRVLLPVGVSPLVSAAVSHTGSFTPGSTGTYTVTIANASSAGATSGPVTVTELAPTALTLTSMSGSGWSCDGSTCTRSDALAPGQSYPPISVAVNIAANAPWQVTNRVTVTGGGMPPAGAQDLTLMTAAALVIQKSHTGDFTQNQKSAPYTVTVSNDSGAGPVNSVVTVTENAPAGLTIAGMSGNGWTCAGGVCTRGDTLLAGAAYPPITVTVDVAPTATSPQVNSVTVTGGGSAPANASDSTTILPLTAVTVATAPSGLPIVVDGVTYAGPRTFYWQAGSTHNVDTVATQGVGTRYRFTSWSDGLARTHAFVTPASTTTLTANFAAEYLLTSSVSPAGGGSIVANLSSSDGYYPASSTLIVTGAPASGYSFGGFTGDLTGGSNPQFLFLSGPRSIAASFTAVGFAPTAVSVTPSDAIGFAGTLTTVYAAAKGYTDLRWVQLLIAVAPDGGGQTFCFVHYDVQGNAFWLYGDGGFFVGPVAPGAASNRLQNSDCALNTSASSVSGSGGTLTVNSSLIFKQAGTRNVYLRAMNQELQDTGWVQRGDWIQMAALPGVLASSPSSGSGATQTFAITYPDLPGLDGPAFGWMQLLIAAAPDGGGQPFCFVHYDRAGNGLWMYSSDVGYFLGPVAPGTASNALSSSACSVDTAAATATNGSGILMVRIPITMKAPMSGAKKIFQRTLDMLNRDTGWQQTGTWIVP